MTSSNINKIVRSSNITLKPWILSKNTSEIVNTCIQKIYKQTPSNFRNHNNNDLLQSKISSPRPENKAPIRTLRHTQNHLPSATASNPPTARPRSRIPPNVSAGSVGGSDRLLSAVMSGTNNKRGAVANLVANKKLLKSPNLKIYGSRRFGSSASSSSASIFRRFDERRRNRMQTAQLNYLLRSFTTNHQPGKFRDLGMNSGVAKYLVPTRNQHMEIRSGAGAGVQVPQAVHVSTAIQRDLMLIDNQLKNRIAMGRSKLDKMTQQDQRDIDPMEGWHHPPPPDLFLTRLNERNVANAELYEQHRRLKNANKMKQFDHLRRLESKTAVGMNTTVAKKFGRVRLTDALHAINKTPSHMRVAEQHMTSRQPGARRFSYREPPTPPAMLPPAPKMSNSAQTQVQAPATVTTPAPKAPTTIVLNTPIKAMTTTPVATTVPAVEPIMDTTESDKPSNMASVTATSAMANTAALRANVRYNRSSYYQPRKF